MPPPGAPLDIHALLDMQRQAAQAEPTDQPLTWVAGQFHPLVPNMRIVRMYVDDTGVSVYSHDGKNGMRHFVPIALVRLVEEVMTLDAFVDAIEDEEAPEDDEPDLDEPDDGPGDSETGGPQGPVANGQTASS